MHKNNYRRSPSKFRFFIAILIIIGLAAFSVYQYMSTNTLSQKITSQQQQNDDLSAQLQAIQSQYQSLQSDYQDLINSSPSPTATPGSSATSSGNAAKVAYLTFDDGPTSLTPQLLNVLKANNVKATFFVAFMGEDTPQKRAILKQESDAGHTIGVHSWTHKYDTIYANEQAFLDDFNKMKGIITDATGIAPTLCRFPGGIGNTVSITASGGKTIMPTLVSDVEKMGITPFDWNAGGEDAETPYPTSSKLVQDVLKDAQGHDNVVILLHDTHQFTIDAVPGIIKELRAQGYTFEMLTPDSKTVQQPFGKKSSD